MGLRSLPIDRAIKVYEVATEEERALIYRIVVKKFKNAELTGPERTALLPAYLAAVKLPRGTATRRTIPPIGAR
jgi:hypothetical protein